MNAILMGADALLQNKAAEIKAMAAKLSTIHCSGCANCSGIVGD